MSLEQTQLNVIRLLLRYKVKIAVNGSLAHSCFKSKLVDRLFAVFGHVAAYRFGSHPCRTSDMVPCKTFPDTFGNVETKSPCDPL